MKSTTQSTSTSKPITASLDAKIDSVEKKLNENSLAWEMLKEQKRTIKRLFTTIFVLIAFIFVMICGFIGGALYVYNNFDIEDVASSVEYVQDGTGNNIIGNDNEVNN